ncbi:MAG: FAD:protein FMN transferase, partial [Chlamydiales bacterium]
DHVHLKGNLFIKDHDLTELDVGGIAKGYAVDLLVERLEEAGFQSIYVEWGGEIRTKGFHPSGREWRVSLMGLDTLDLSNKSIAASGSCFQKWSVDNTSYTHIIDPQTKQPIKVTEYSITRVHVISQTCLQADALATALMLFNSTDEAEKWAEQNGIWAFIQNKY